MSGELQAIKVVGGVLPATLMRRIQANELSDPSSLSPSSYHLVGNEKPRDAAARAWSYLRGAWTAWRSADASDASVAGTGLARDRWLLVLLDELGYGRLPAATAVSIDGVEYPISHRWYHVPIHLLGPKVDLDRRNPGVSGAARAPQAMLQEYLNRTDDDLWGIVSNGLRLRLLRDSTAFAGSAYVEFDLEAIFDGELYAEFQLLWLLCHQSRLEKRGGPEAGPADCWLESWRSEAAEAGTRALERLREGVEAAIKTLGTGFLANPKNDWLRSALHQGALSDREYHKALLRLIYRLLFTFVAEDRGALLDPEATTNARDRYQQYFSTARLRKLSRLRSGGVHPDLWRSQQMVLGALGGDGMPQLGLPALGGLFDPDRRAPVVEGAPHRDLLLGAELTNQALLGAIRQLAWIKLQNERMQAIDYRHLGAEELGGVYESLLELVPRVDLDAQEFDLVHLAGNERKTTGSYYTPPALVSALLDSALDPVLDEAVSTAVTAEEKERNLLAITVCDPASGSGGFLVAAARRIARRLAQVRSGEDEPTPEGVQHALHDVVARCIYGVDMNDLAAELAKVSLWLEALEPGKPLGFLDARIRIGNSLFGTSPALLNAGVPSDAFKEIEGDDKKVAAAVRKRNAIELKGQGLLGGFNDPTLAKAYTAARERLTTPTDDLTSIRARGAEWDALMASPARRALQLRADAWAAAFVWPLVTHAAPPPTTAVVDDLASMGGAAQHPDTVTVVEILSKEYQFFHWHLEFPEVFGQINGTDAGPDGWAGGFSCMLGNPPWEQVQLDPREFFAASAPDIADAPTMTVRDKMIDSLKVDDPPLHRRYVDALRENDGFKKFAHSSQRFPLTSFGRLNTYSLFAELFGSLISEVGLSGIIVPTGIATDSFNQSYFRDLVEKKRLVSLYDFENRRGTFDGVHRSFKFSVLTVARREHPRPPSFAFFLDDPAEIPTSSFRLTSEEIATLSPNTKTLPIFRTRRDAELALHIQKHGVPFIREEPRENSWNVTPSLMFMTNVDSVHFNTADRLLDNEGELNSAGSEITLPNGDVWVPLREAKTIHQFNHRWATLDRGKYRDVLDDERRDPSFAVTPRYWLPKDLAVERYPLEPSSWVLGWRDIARSTDERTVIASISPFSACPEVYRTAAVSDASSALSLVAMWNSFVFDFAARQKVAGTHVAFFVFNQLPVLSRSTIEAECLWLDSTWQDWILKRALELSYTSWDLSGLAADVGSGGPPFIWDRDRRAALRAELDAGFFHLYGLSRDDLCYVLDTFPIVQRKDEAAFGEYRTKRLILENYDAMQRCIDEGTTFVSSLSPAPGFGPRHPEKESA